MCLTHAGSGPLMVIKALLGGGPEATLMAPREYLIEQADRMNRVAERMRCFKPSPTMKQFEEAKKQWEKE